MRCLGWHDRHQTCTVRLSPSPSTLLPNPTENNTPPPSPAMALQAGCFAEARGPG